MKYRTLFCLCGGLLLAACSDDEVLSDAHLQLPAMRTVAATESPTFAWEDVPSIKLEGISTPVTLPWYAGASSNVPDELLLSYKAADGWKMLYNFCSPSDYAEAGKYYLIFYNIFTGTLRTYYYNAYDVTDATTTFWHFQANRWSRLLSGWSSYAVANDLAVVGDVTIGNDLIASNVSKSPVKSLGRGWNVFDVELSGYDPNLAEGGPLYFSLYTHEIKDFKVELDGNISLESKGTILQQVQNQSLGQKIANTVVSVGEVAAPIVEDILGEKDSQRSSTQASESPQTRVGGLALAKSGLAFLQKFIFKKPSQPLNFDVSLTTKGSFQTYGTVITAQQSNIMPITKLLIPGSPMSTETTFLPSFEDQLGVWNLKTTPVVRTVTFHVEMPGKRQDLPLDPGWEGSFNPDPPLGEVGDGDLTGGGGSLGGSGLGGGSGAHGTPAYGQMPYKFDMLIARMDTIDKDDIEINPDLLPYLDSCTVEVVPIEIRDSLFSPLNNAENHSYYSVIDSDTRNVIARDSTGAYCSWDGFGCDRSHYEYNNFLNITQYRFRYGVSDYGVDNVEVKVIVTLYPKASMFNPEPVTFMRTYKARIVFDRTLAKDFDHGPGILLP